MSQDERFGALARKIAATNENIDLIARDTHMRNIGYARDLELILSRIDLLSEAIYGRLEQQPKILGKKKKRHTTRRG